MNKTIKPVTSSFGTSKLVRPKFAPGMLLQHDDLEQLSAYTHDLSALLFRSLFGCGVICGLTVKAEADCGKLYITVDAGVALDCGGNPIHVPDVYRFPLENECNDIPKTLWVLLCGTTKCCAPRTSTCASDDDDPHSVCTREREGFEVRIVSEHPKCVCGCPEEHLPAYDRFYDEDEKCLCVDPTWDCYKDHYLGLCKCQCDDCASSTSCDGNCVLLAALRQDAAGNWISDHRVRRFIRPVLVRDPKPRTDQASKGSGQERLEAAEERLIIMEAAEEEAMRAEPKRARGGRPPFKPPPKRKR